MPRLADVETERQQQQKEQQESTLLTPTTDADAGQKVSQPTPRRAAESAPVLPKLIAGRFRLVAQLGSGGMGRVFRAEDTALSQDVALKLLPPRLAHDPSALKLLRDEVRLARRVSHPNVCRVHDLGETEEGELFLTMELVEGETLAAVLRRVGRLAGDKAREIARQIAAGLTAAHAEGIVHRDLKPANVLLDADGRARIADFGIATAAGKVVQGEIAGTPGYMAPEQLAGLGATAKSDVFSLGLVLYELFTGRRAIEAATLDELRRKHDTGVERTPSQLVRELDPGIERVILSCLEKEPARRPTALEVLTELAGGDALRAAQEAGQTPSPEAVAGSGPTGALQPRIATLLFLFFTLAILSGFALQAANSRVRLEFLDVIPLPQPPQVLTFRVKEMLAALGIPEPQGRRESGFVYEQSVMKWLGEGTDGRLRAAAIASGRASAVRFGFMRGLAEPPEHNFRAAPGPREREPMVPGAVTLRLDAQGRLVRLAAGPDPNAPPAQSPDEVAPALLRLAGLDPGQLKPVAPSGVPPVYGDARLAFEGPVPDTPGLDVRAELVTFRGHPVFFEVYGPWGPSREPRNPAGLLADLLLLCETLALVAGTVLAVKNVRAKRADRAGAAWIFVFIFVLDFVVSMLRATYGWSAAEVRLVFSILAASLLGAATDSVFYLALEPHVRKLWPESLVSWSRLLSGRFKDAMVARDVLLGLAFYEVVALGTMAVMVPFRASAAQFPVRVDLSPLNGMRFYVAALLDAPRNGVDLALFYLLLLILVRSVVKKGKLAGLLFFAVLTALSAATISAASSAPTPAVIGLAALVAGAFTVMMTRLGFLAIVVIGAVLSLAARIPMTYDLSPWYGPMSAWSFALVIAVALYGWWFSRAPADRLALEAHS